MAYFGPSEGINRAGRPATILCTLRNLGGQPAEHVTATLDVPAGVTVLNERREKNRPALAQPAEDRRVASQDRNAREVRPRHDGRSRSRCDGPVDRGNPLDQASRRAQDRLRPRAQASARASTTFGAYLFPGLCHRIPWKPILGYPCRKPILGWYDEAESRVRRLADQVGR